VGFTSDNITNGISLLFHGPYHGKMLFVRRYVPDEDVFSMVTINMVVEFLMYSSKENFTICLT